MKRALLIAAVVALCASAAAAQETISLKLGSAVPPNSWPNTRGTIAWTQAVEKDSGGLILFQNFLGGTVVTQRNTYDRLLNGVVDAVYAAFAETPGTFKKITVSTLPFEAPRAIDASIALWRLYESGLVSDEMAAARPICIFAYNPSGLQTSRPIAKAEDLKGIKLATIARAAAEELTLLGGTPVTMPPSEIYQSIQRGLVAGAVLGWTGTQTFRLDEVTKFHLDVPFGNNPAYFMMNKDAYAKLPDVAKKAIDKYSGEPLTKRLGGGGIEEDKKVKAKLAADPTRTIGPLAPAEKERWRKLFEPIVEEWVKTTPDGATVLAAYREELAKIEKEPR